MENLPLLRDIHLPTEVSAFPLGYGWLLLLAALLMALVAYKIWHKYQLKSQKKYALKLLQKNNANTLYAASQISEILRRICRLKFKHAVSLNGQEWLDFLNKKCSQKLGGEAANLLLYAPYIAEGKRFSEEDYTTLRAYVKQWIGENL